MGQGSGFENRKSEIQDRVKGRPELFDLLRHLDTIEIRTETEELEITSTFPDKALPFGKENASVCRVIDYDEDDELEDLVEVVVDRARSCFKHVDTLTIDLDEDDLTLEAGFPDFAGMEDQSEDEDEEDEEEDEGLKISRTVDLEKKRWRPIRQAIESLVTAVQERMLEPDPEYDKDRCDRCKMADCCHDWRIHMTEGERIRILAFLGEKDTEEVYDRYFEGDEDLSGFYRTVFKHAGPPNPQKEDSEGSCVFLKEGDDGQKRCSIYEVRPRVCREFDAGYCTEWTILND